MGLHSIKKEKIERLVDCSAPTLIFLTSSPTFPRFLVALSFPSPANSDGHLPAFSSPLPLLSSQTLSLLPSHLLSFSLSLSLHGGPLRSEQLAAHRQACAEALRPKHAETVGTNFIRCETLSLAAVAARARVAVGRCSIFIAISRFQQVHLDHLFKMVSSILEESA